MYTFRETMTASILWDIGVYRENAAWLDLHSVMLRSHGELISAEGGKSFSKYHKFDNLSQGRVYW